MDLYQPNDRETQVMPSKLLNIELPFRPVKSNQAFQLSCGPMYRSVGYPSILKSEAVAKLYPYFMRVY